MRPGPAPKPTALRVVEGNRGRRPLNRKEPKPRKASRTPPAFLDKLAKTEWRRVMKELEQLGLATVLDRAMLALYCQEWSRYVEASAWIKKNGTTYVLRDKDGNVRYVAQFPQVAIARAAAEAVRKLAAEFGFSPSTRSRLQGPGSRKGGIDVGPRGKTDGGAG